MGPCRSSRNVRGANPYPLRRYAMLRLVGRGSLAMLATLVACSSHDNGSPGDGGQTSSGDGGAKNPDTAPIVSVDRFSDAFAHLFRRSANSALPAANAPINCDQGPFITHGLGPNGERVTYYNFDVL